VAIDSGILSLVRAASSKRRLYLPHALRQMARTERMIRTEEVRAVIETGDVIEDYPDDPRGHSCLMMGLGENGRAVHVVCAPKIDYLAIITAYLPDPAEWNGEFKTRRRK
jgi:hypothetical protein